MHKKINLWEVFLQNAVREDIEYRNQQYIVSHVQISLEEHNKGMSNKIVLLKTKVDVSNRFFPN